MRESVARLDFEPEVLLVSFHGIPKSQVAAGDPYYDHCLETWRLLRERLQLSQAQCPISFQSRFGPAEWLQPYTDETVKELARKRVKRMTVLTPGFSVDCLETISEIGVENRDFFKESGGEKFDARGKEQCGDEAKADGIDGEAEPGQRVGAEARHQEPRQNALADDIHDADAEQGPSYADRAEIKHLLQVDGEIALQHRAGKEKRERREKRNAQ